MNKLAFLDQVPRNAAAPGRGRAQAGQAAPSGAVSRLPTPEERRAIPAIARTRRRDDPADAAATGAAPVTRRSDAPAPPTPAPPADGETPLAPGSDIPASEKPAPTARPARMRRRHWGLLLSFVALVIAPLALIAGYLFQVAEDQYASTTGFTVRSNEVASATDMLGGLASFTGYGGQSDADILHEFIVSQEMVERLDARVDLIGRFSAAHGTDPVFAIAPDATIEDLVRYWQRIVRISYNQSTGLIDLRVLSFDPALSQQIAQAIIAESQALVNGLNAQARADAMRFAEQDLDAALARLRDSREALIAFRTRTQIVDPESDLQGRMGVLNNLQQQLAEALVDYDLLTETTTNRNDPRLLQAARRTEVIRARIAQERQTFTMEEIGTAGSDYPTLMAEYEGLVVDREFAEESYRAALTALDLARTNAARQSRYLAVYIQPTQPETAEFPRRGVVTGLAALFLVIGWAVLALIYYSIRDRH